MSENLKNTLTIILKCYKEDNMNDEEVLTILDSLLRQNNNNGSTVITYPINVPSTPNWWDTIRYELYQPYCTNSTATFDFEKQQNTNVTD